MTSAFTSIVGDKLWLCPNIGNGGRPPTPPLDRQWANGDGVTKWQCPPASLRPKRTSSNEAATEKSHKYMLNVQHWCVPSMEVVCHDKWINLTFMGRSASGKQHLSEEGGGRAAGLRTSLQQRHRNAANHLVDIRCCSSAASIQRRPEAERTHTLPVGAVASVPPVVVAVSVPPVGVAASR
mmetsp:Transcript_41861/g.125263  ORF Transcript_41861/g.125263 Transcript_41861/m.125263 type:complete len:181 (-) Transcript_41861:586-1128(-)